MFVELGNFINEKELYNQKVIELKNTVVNKEDLTRALEEERLKFKGVNRKYLPTAMSIIKNTFNIEYSLYKIGRDVDANFKTIETNVNKTQTEIATEMNQFVQQANGMQLTADQANKLNLAIDVIMTYVDDTVVNEDQNKAFFLNHSKVVASSLDLPVTQKIQEPVVTETIQHNPYANKPLDLNNTVPNSQPVSDSKEPLIDPFASLYGTEPIQNNVSLPTHDILQTQSNQLPTSNEISVNTSNNVTQISSVPVVMPPEIPVNNVEVLINESAPQITSQVQQVSTEPSNIQINMPETTLLSDEKVVVGKEKNGIFAQIIGAILIPIMVALSSLIVYGVSQLDFIVDLLSSMPNTLNQIAICLFIGTIFLLLAGPIVKIAKTRTAYLERFMVPTALLSFPITWLCLKLLLEYKNGELKLILYVVSLFLYLPFVTLLFIRSFVNSDNSKTVKAPKWNIFDKVGMLLVIYIFIIPTVYLVISLFKNIDILNKIINVMYFVGNQGVSKNLDTVLLVATLAITSLIMIVRTVIIKKAGRKI